MSIEEMNCKLCGDKVEYRPTWVCIDCENKATWVGVKVLLKRKRNIKPKECLEK